MTDSIHDLTRRGLLAQAAAGVALAAAFAPQQAAGKPAEDAADVDRDRGFVMGAGLTAEEADCWRLAAETAGAFFALPELHPMDRQEVATAVHVIQNKLLGRPTYRRYLELAKAPRDAK